MSKKLVKYHNNLHDISFAGMTTKERSLFFSICFLLKEKGTTEISLSFEQLKELSKFSSSTVQSFINIIRSTYKKLIALTFYQETEKKITEFVLFTKYEVLKNEREVIIKVNDDFKYILNHLDNNYTEHELLEYSSLKSDYSQLTYSFLKKWNGKREILISMNDFRKMLHISEKYDTTNFNKRIFKPILKELPNYFYNLKIEKLKKGRKVTSLKFTWESKVKIIKMAEKTNEIIISQELHNIIEKIKTLHFFQNIMTHKNIEKLIKKYDEKTLIQIFKRAKNHTYQQIRSIKYFDFLYESIVKEPIITIKSNENMQIYPSVKKIEETKKIDITLGEFNKKYKEYLAEIGLPHNLFLKKGFEGKYNIVRVEENGIQKIKIFTEKDIPKNELLGKNGKKLAGVALQMRINKILQGCKYN